MEACRKEHQHRGSSHRGSLHTGLLHTDYPNTDYPNKGWVHTGSQRRDWFEQAVADTHTADKDWPVRPSRVSRQSLWR